MPPPVQKYHQEFDELNLALVKYQDGYVRYENTIKPLMLKIKAEKQAVKDATTKAAKDACRVSKKPLQGPKPRIPTLYHALQDAQKALEIELDQQWKIAHDNKEVVKSGAGIYQFVRLELVPDLKGMKVALGAKISAVSDPCPCCPDTYDDLQRSSEGPKEERVWWTPADGPVAPEGALQPVFWAIPRKQWRCCVLHADCRITEKLVHQHVHIIHQAKIKAATLPQDDPRRAVVADVEERWLRVMNEDLKINGGNCRVQEVWRMGVLQLGKISLNGGDARVIKAARRKLLACIGDLAAVMDESFAAAHAKRVEAWEQWATCDVWFRKMYWTEEDYTTAEAQFKAFVQLYRQAHCPEANFHSITHYMHILEHHTMWFLGQGSPVCPALASTQAMEAMHRFRNKFLRSATMHGRPFDIKTAKGVVRISRGAHLWQLMIKAFNLRTWAAAVADRGEQGKYHSVDVSELGCLDTVPQANWTKAELKVVLRKWPRDLPIHLVGRGDTKNTCSNKVLEFDSATQVSRSKLAERGTSIPLAKLTGKQRVVRAAGDLSDSMEKARKQRLTARMVKKMLSRCQGIKLDLAAGAAWSLKPPQPNADPQRNVRMLTEEEEALSAEDVLVNISETIVRRSRVKKGKKAARTAAPRKPAPPKTASGKVQKPRAKKGKGASKSK
jgi:hypothetical protein